MRKRRRRSWNVEKWVMGHGLFLTGGSLRLTRSLHTPAQVVTVGLYDLLSPFSSGVVSQTGFLMCSGNCSNLV